MPFPKTWKTERGTDLGGGRVRARKEGNKKSRDPSDHAKSELLSRHQRGDAATVDGSSHLGLRGGQGKRCGKNNECFYGPYSVPGIALGTSCPLTHFILTTGITIPAFQRRKLKQTG